jgi:exonuclease SbcD
MHDMREIKGTYEELMSKKNYEGTDTDDYIHAVLTDENDVIDAMAKLRVVYPNLMKLSYDNKRTQSQQIVTDAENVDKKTPLELFEEFYEKQNNQEMTEEQKQLSRELIESIWEV